MKFPIIELVDRLAIAQVKWDRTSLNEKELDWYNDQIKNYDFKLISDCFNELKMIHNKIWDLESDIRSGYEQKLGLEEIGRRALLIRDWNNKRIAIKNQMAEILDCPVREIKKDHLSE